VARSPAPLGLPVLAGVFLLKRRAMRLCEPDVPRSTEFPTALMRSSRRRLNDPAAKGSTSPPNRLATYQSIAPRVQLMAVKRGRAIPMNSGQGPVCSSLRPLSLNDSALLG